MKNTGNCIEARRINGGLKGIVRLVGTEKNECVTAKRGVVE